MKRYGNLFETVVSFDNLYAAFRNASKTRELKPDVLNFSMNLEENLAALHYELTSQTYKRGTVNQFIVYDPVQRLIMAAPFRDRVVDWALYRVLNPLVDKRYINTSSVGAVKVLTPLLKSCRNLSDFKLPLLMSAKWTLLNIFTASITKFY